MNKKFEKELLKKLDMLIKLSANSILNPNESQADSILRLKGVGLRPKQIASVLNTTQNYVNVVLSKKRGNKK